MLTYVNFSWQNVVMSAVKIKPFKSWETIEKGIYFYSCMLFVIQTIHFPNFIDRKIANFTSIHQLYACESIHFWLATLPIGAKTKMKWATVRTEDIKLPIKRLRGQSIYYMSAVASQHATQQISPRNVSRTWHAPE